MNQTDVFQLKTAALEKVKERQYWTSLLSQIPSDCRFPYDSQLLDQNDEEASFTFSFPAQLEKAILKASGASDLRMFIIFMTAAVTLLHRYSGRTDIMASAPVLRQRETQPVINDLLPLLVKINPTMSFRDCLEHVKQAFQEVYAHQNYPVKILLDELHPLHKKGEPRFGVSLAMNDLQQPASLRALDTNLFISIQYDEGTLTGKLSWNLKHYTFDTAKRIAGHFCMLADRALSAPETLVSELQLLSHEERESIITTFNHTNQPYPKEKSIVDLFKEQAALKPNQPAIVYEDVSFTYGEADELSDRVAAFLIKEGVRHEEPVGLMVHRSAEMVIGILGILKAGCPYLPIDVNMPSERMDYMLKNSGSRFVITNKDYDISAENQKSLFIEEMMKFKGAAEHGRLPSPKNLAYVLYTSGTTGKPKGVMVEHRQVINLVYGIDSLHFEPFSQEHLRIGMLASHIFDASVQTIFPAVLLGHTLYIAPDHARMDGKQLWSFYEENRIHISDATPSHLRLMLKAAEKEPHHVDELKLIMAGGEILPPQLVQQYLQTFRADKPVMTNNYGPTECTVQSAAFTIPEHWNEAVVPIGRPMPNEQIYILDHCGQPVPIGVYGELCIAGDGVARGYICQPELTAKKFTEPQHIPAGKLYHTGDLARWRSDGLIEFFGRYDDQVKIRGFRVELDEIRKALLDYRESGQIIHDAVIIPVQKESDDQFLVAYLISDQKLKTRKMRGFLGEKLPGYMIPRRFIRVDSFPMNLSGKLDLKALPDPMEEPESDEQVIKPHNETEKKLVSIFAGILNIPESDISMEDNFFDIGGNSFHIVELSNKLKEQFGQELSVVQLFQYTSVSAIAAQLSRQTESEGSQANAESGEEAAEDLENVAQLLGGISDE
ncbi:amino acid adenylation domain-containing protein [Bacillus inaquosorum]|uniref:non-ribosomal peptide synthetase n=1 Tax=Bacillus inaquosorum TaxID=483913 RepID=UPI002280956C|nr:non-ribosomal peptide synthetase [Bacillus inaquosorum]MCY8846406.1 amino acid adenylation domain-containing protein [Bacillus inaquosorum]MCY9088915.1 amino acid adenylation domain-containing protein [Bacillus inaquosorum]